ncbi:hypothetical protein [Clostridium zeae]
MQNIGWQDLGEDGQVAGTDLLYLTIKS